ncbi:CsgE family curli-type amyloid fiber assembly protein [Methylotetracoccus oryzae]|uniref:CsgE family curli-type amyloid fiber assembly protein n=1 Tax=Methylotetracoccus oryzae TaxID=1919059 RepID=UPI0011199DAF|nr:CsgE family curli-type amyloid fiber assembly protein [Methylotetracoccus oryzae]
MSRKVGKQLIWLSLLFLTANLATAAGNTENAPSAKPQVPARPAPHEDFIDEGVLESDSGLEGGLEIQGLMTDQTVTKFGHEFFDAFTHAWRPIEGVSYDIKVSELFDPIRGSLIRVTLNDSPMWESYVTPRFEDIRTAAAAVAKDIRQLLKNTYLQSDEGGLY